MNIDNIISFIYIQRLKNFNKAAKKLFITQPSLSSRIKTLEKDLGVVLFNRDRKSVELTKEGHIFLPYAHKIYNNYLEAKARLQNTNTPITVGSIISFSTSLLPNAVYQYQKLNHHLSIDIITAKTSTILDKLVKNECQIAITEKIDEPNIISEPIYLDNVSLFVSPSHRFANANYKITIEEIASEPLICFNSQSDYWQEIAASFRAKNLIPNIVFNIDSMEAAKSAITKDIGICFLPELSLEKDVSSRHICKVPIESNYDFKREISLSFLEDSDQMVREFSEFLLYAIKGD